MESYTHEQYAFLKELLIGAENHGVYRDGEWLGNGKE